jgi:hypothetical protein
MFLLNCLQGCGNTRLMSPLLGDSNNLSGMDPKTFEVVDSSQLKFFEGLITVGYGSTTGVWTPCGYGNRTGRPVPGSKFTRIEIGQSMSEVVELIGYPDAKHVGLAKRPGFSLNKIDIRDDYRVETSYVNLGRLVFAYVHPNYRQITLGLQAANKVVSCPGLRLKWIIHNQREPAGPMESDGAHFSSYSGPPPESTDAKLPSGMNEFGQVVDPCKLERGTGKIVPGPGSISGEVHGKASADSKFNLLAIGMTRDKVLDVLGSPNGTSTCGRTKYVGLGELEFSKPAAGSQRLIWIIHNPNEKL